MYVLAFCTRMLMECQVDVFFSGVDNGFAILAASQVGQPVLVLHEHRFEFRSVVETSCKLRRDHNSFHFNVMKNMDPCY